MDISKYGFVVARAPAGESISEERRLFNHVVDRLKAVGLKPEEITVSDDQDQSFSAMCVVETSEFPVVFSMIRDSYNRAGTMLFVGNRNNHIPTFIDYIYVMDKGAKFEEGLKGARAEVLKSAKHHLSIISEVKHGFNQEAFQLLGLEGFFKKLERF